MKGRAQRLFHSSCSLSFSHRSLFKSSMGAGEESFVTQLELVRVDLFSPGKQKQWGRSQSRFYWPFSVVSTADNNATIVSRSHPSGGLGRLKTMDTTTLTSVCSGHLSKGERERRVGGVRSLSHDAIKTVLERPALIELHRRRKEISLVQRPAGMIEGGRSIFSCVRSQGKFDAHFLFSSHSFQFSQFLRLLKRK